MSIGAKKTLQTGGLMLICKRCKKEVYSTINDKCSDCYYNWEGLLPLGYKIAIILMISLYIIQLSLIIGGLNG